MMQILRCGVDSDEHFHLRQDLLHESADGIFRQATEEATRASQALIFKDRVPCEDQ